MRISEQVLNVIKAFLEHSDVSNCPWLISYGSKRVRPLVDRIQDRLPNLTKRQIVGAIGYLTSHKRIEADWVDLEADEWGPEGGLWPIIYLPDDREVAG